MIDTNGVTSSTYDGVGVVAGLSGFPPVAEVPFFKMVAFSFGGVIQPDATTIRITDIQQRRQITFCFIF